MGSGSCSIITIVDVIVVVLRGLATATNCVELWCVNVSVIRKMKMGREGK